MNVPRVIVADIRAANLCMGGARMWFDTRGLSWNVFVTEGLPIEQVEGYHDGLADKVLFHTRRRLGR